MPELPEVETTRRGIEPHLSGQAIREVIIRDHRLRWPVDKTLPSHLPGQRITAITRRGKYLLLTTAAGTIIIHLGMSGSLRVLPCDTAALKHDHVDIVFGDHQCLRLRDPRRFGSVLWTTADPMQHELLKDLGPEPLGDDFNDDYLYGMSRKRKIAVKQFIMNSHVVVGVGNIYVGYWVKSWKYLPCGGGSRKYLRQRSLVPGGYKTKHRGGTCFKTALRQTG